jgi:hypothetical protein
MARFGRASVLVLLAAGSALAARAAGGSSGIVVSDPLHHARVSTDVEGQTHSGEADDDCSFDQGHQASVIASIAARFPGGSVNETDLIVTWTGPADGTTTFAYGGCEDLGSMITRSTRLESPRTRDEVFSLARELATRFWSNDIVSARRATEALVSGLTEATYTTERVGGKVLYSVPDPGYVELSVEHEYQDGLDRVVIAWQGNF